MHLSLSTISTIFFFYFSISTSIIIINLISIHQVFFPRLRDLDKTVWRITFTDKDADMSTGGGRKPTAVGAGSGNKAKKSGAKQGMNDYETWLAKHEAKKHKLHEHMTLKGEFVELEFEN